MIVLVTGGLTLWLLAVLAIVSICRAAALADDEAARHIVPRADTVPPSARPRQPSRYRAWATTPRLVAPGRARTPTCGSRSRAAQRYRST